MKVYQITLHSEVTQIQAVQENVFGTSAYKLINRDFRRQIREALGDTKKMVDSMGFETKEFKVHRCAQTSPKIPVFIVILAVDKTADEILREQIEFQIQNVI
jgi:hypothetical protein